jgi:DNA polymerase III subunit delta'
MAGFKNILGHEREVEVLQRAVMLGKVSHAYSFEGEAGCGKKEIADAFAITLQCEKGAKDACMECPSCKQAITRNHPDIIYLHHEKPNTISVGEIREQINQDVYVKPYNGNRKIYIIEDAQKMNIQAQNALLKTIEEPPSYVVIILLTTNEEAFLPTIRSRCVSLKIKPVKTAQIEEYLEKILSVPKDQAKICAAFAQGNIGKAARLSASEDFAQMRASVVQLLKRLREIDLYELVSAVKQITEYKLEIMDYFDIMMVWYRDVLLYKATSDVNQLIFQDEIYEIKKQVSTSSYEGLELIMKGIDKAKRRIEANVNLDLTLEMLLLTIKEN